MTTTYLISRFSCGCIATIMVVDKDTTARDRARFWDAVARTKPDLTATEENVKPANDAWECANFDDGRGPCDLRKLREKQAKRKAKK